MAVYKAVNGRRRASLTPCQRRGGDRATVLIAAVIVSVLASGCGTLLNMADGCRPFGGVAYDVDYTINGSGEGDDLPFSLAGDTLTLPVTTYSAIKKWRAPPVNDE